MSSRRDHRRPFALVGGLLLGLALLAPAVAGEAAPEAAKPEAATSADAKPDVAKPDVAKPDVAKPEAAKPEAARAAEAAAPNDRVLAPYLAVRSLQVLQDQVAHGSAAAQAAQPRMLVHVGEIFMAADPSVWKDPRNAGAAALYLFSAGRAKAVRAVLERGDPFTPEGDRLVKGALAYAEGRDEVARTLLGDLDPKALRPSLGGHLALVLATLFADSDPARAGRMLDAARLLAPGTLVEEAALRREIFQLADPASLEKFVALSRQYLRRYHGSVFAANFKSRMISFGVRLAVAGDVAQLAKLDPVFEALPQAEQRAVYLTMSRDALVAGRPEATRYAAARAAALAPGPAEAERARLYTAAAGVASDTASTVRATLASLDGSRLPDRDIALRDAAAAVATSVEESLGDRGQDFGRLGPPPDSPAAMLIDRANSAMATGDALLAIDTGTPAAAAKPPVGVAANGGTP